MVCNYDMFTQYMNRNTSPEYRKSQESRWGDYWKSDSYWNNTLHITYSCHVTLYGWTLGVDVTELNLILSLTAFHIIAMSPLCTVSTAYPPRILVSMSSRARDTRELLKRRHLERRDKMRCATLSREMKISASLVGDGVARLKTLHFSLCLLILSSSVHDLFFPVWGVKIKTIFNCSNIVFPGCIVCCGRSHLLYNQSHSSLGHVLVLPANGLGSNSTALPVVLSPAI